MIEINLLEPEKRHAPVRPYPINIPKELKLILIGIVLFAAGYICGKW